MSTNYYLRNKEDFERHNNVMQNRNQAIDEFLAKLADWSKHDQNDLYSLRLEVESYAWLGYEEIHIGKRSMGWKPLFQKQTQFSSVRELKKFYDLNSHLYDIVDEYNRVHTWDELKEELIDWIGERENGNRGDNYKDADGYLWATYEFS